MKLSKLDDFIARAGDGAVIMACPDARDYLREFSDPLNWDQRGMRWFYRGALVELHDEWAWGWMVRKADGTYVDALAAGSRSAKTAQAVECEASQSGAESATPKHLSNTPYTLGGDNG